MILNLCAAELFTETRSTAEILRMEYDMLHMGHRDAADDSVVKNIGVDREAQEVDAFAF